MTKLFREGYGPLSNDLLAIVKDEQASNLNRSAAAYYLGEMRVAKAADLLAVHITLRFDESKLPEQDYIHFVDTSEYPAMEALVKIGNASIPAVIRNLAESADPKARDLSVRVLYRIDGDKEIVQLRLQKALAAQTDEKKQARLKSALQALHDTKFEK